MSTLVTLFGGLAGVLLLYVLGGFVPGLSPRLRAGVAALVPLLAYFVHAAAHWPGLDVLAIHISVFAAAAYALNAMTAARRRGGRVHWAPVLLVVFLGGVVVINAGLLYVSTRGLPAPLARWWLGGERVYSGFSGVVAHGQDAAKGVSAELSQAHRESVLGWRVELAGLDSDGPSRTLTVRVRDRTGLPVERVEAELRLLRPGATQPVHTLALNAINPGEYRAVLELPAAGRWLAELRLQRDGTERYRDTREVVVQ